MNKQYIVDKLKVLWIESLSSGKEEREVLIDAESGDPLTLVAFPSGICSVRKAQEWRTTLLVEFRKGEQDGEVHWEAGVGAPGQAT